MEMTQDKRGQFVKGGRGGPGRKKLVEAQDRYKRETLAECAKVLSDDIPRLENQLRECDAAISEAEAAFVDGLAPILKQRAEVDVTLSRARVAKHYVANPYGFGGATPAVDVAKSEYQTIAWALQDARRELELRPQPPFTRTEALGDSDRWTKVHEYERCRDAVTKLEKQEGAARRKLESLGSMVPRPVTDANFNVAEPKVRTISAAREMVNV